MILTGASSSVWQLIRVKAARPVGVVRWLNQRSSPLSFFVTYDLSLLTLALLNCFSLQEPRPWKTGVLCCRLLCEAVPAVARLHVVWQPSLMEHSICLVRPLNVGI